MKINNLLLNEEQWESLMFINVMMSYKIATDTEAKGIEIDKIRKTQLHEMEEVNKKLDLIIKHLGIVDKV